MRSRAKAPCAGVQVRTAQREEGCWPGRGAGAWDRKQGREAGDEGPRMSVGLTFEQQLPVRPVCPQEGPSCPRWPHAEMLPGGTNPHQNLPTAPRPQRPGSISRKQCPCGWYRLSPRLSSTEMTSGPGEPGPEEEFLPSTCCRTSDQPPKRPLFLSWAVSLAHVRAHLMNNLPPSTFYDCKQRTSTLTGVGITQYPSKMTPHLYELICYVQMPQFFSWRAVYSCSQM